MCICFCVYALHTGFVREMPKDSERDFKSLFDSVQDYDLKQKTQSYRRVLIVRILASYINS